MTSLLARFCQLWITLPLGALAACALAGCGSPLPSLTPVTGAVTYDGKPLEDAFVVFLPQGDTKGHGGMGKTNAAGRYEVMAAKGNGRKGLPSGEYKVVISRRRLPDGSLPPPKVPPIESGARETVPERYTKVEETPLSATIGSHAQSVDLTLDGK